MTDSFNINISGEDILKRLTAAERKNESLTAYIKRFETDLDNRITAVDRARVRGDDGMHDLVTRTANSIYAEIKKLEQCFNRLDDQHNDYTGAFEQRLDTLEPLVKDCIAEALDAGEKADLLNDRVKDYTLALREMTRKPNAPEPPVDTAWHPYYAEVDGPDGVHPSGNRRVVVMLRNGEINRPDRADVWDWSECTHRTIVAWRYAKEGE